jgi:hypothetical protein
VSGLERPLDVGLLRDPAASQTRSDREAVALHMHSSRTVIRWRRFFQLHRCGSSGTSRVQTGNVALRVSHSVQVHLFSSCSHHQEGTVSEQRMPRAFICHLCRCLSAIINTCPLPLSHINHLPTCYHSHPSYPAKGPRIAPTTSQWSPTFSPTYPGCTLNPLTVSVLDNRSILVTSENGKSRNGWSTKTWPRS